MYKCRYSFWDEQRFPGFERSLKNLYARSLKYYYDNLDSYKRDSMEMKRDISFFDKFCKALEYHYVSIMKMGIVTKTNFENVLKSFNNIEVIELFPNNKKDLYAVTVGNKIFVNPYVKPIRGYNLEESIQMILSHELGHIIANSWEKDISVFSKDILARSDVSKHFSTYIGNFSKVLLDGIILLEDAVVQDCAENVVYRLKGVSRPAVTGAIKKSFPKDRVFMTNFSLYKEFQEIAVKYARCLDFVNCHPTDDYDTILKKLSKKVFSIDFIQKMYAEIIMNPEKINDFVLMLICMGKVKDDSYSNFDLGTNQQGSLEKALNLFDAVAEENRCDILMKEKKKRYQ